MKKLSCMLLAALLLCLTACGAAQTEETVTAPETAYYLKEVTGWQSGQQSLEIAQNGESLAWIGADGALYTKTIGPAHGHTITPELEEDQELTAVGVDSSGNVLAATVTRDSDGKITGEAVLTLDTEGQLLSSLELEPWGQSAYSLGADGKGNLALLYSQNGETTLRMVSAEGEDLDDYSLEGDGQLLAKGTTLLLLTWEKEQPVLYTVNLTEEDLLEARDLPEDVTAAHVTGQGDVLLETTEGVTDLQGQLLFTWQSLGVQGSQLLYLYSENQEDIYFYAIASGSYLETTLTSPQDDQRTVLKLACWLADDTLSQAVTDFNLSQEEYQVEIMSYGGGGDAYKGMAEMNADLLSGNQPDLYAMNAIDEASLQNVGLLMDLVPLMEQDPEFQREDYLENIFDLYTEDGAMYQLPTGFEFRGIFGPKSVLEGHETWTISEYVACLQAQPELFTIHRSYQEGMLSMCILSGMADVVDLEAGTCDFTGDAFLELLEFCGSFPDQRQDGNLYGGWVEGIAHLDQFHEEYGGEVMIVGFPNSLADGPVIDCSETFAICSYTEHVDGAWAFLKYLLSQEVQEQGWRFPVQRAAFEAALEGAKYPGSDDRSSLPGNRDIPLSESEIQMVRDLTENATRRSFRNDPIQDIIEEEAQSYFAGDKTAQEVAEIIDKRVKIYLGESS